jgi:hypothetical protein
MRRNHFLALLVFAVTISGALGHPARPLYVPAPAAKAPPPRLIADLRGTAWKGKYLTANRIFTFESDGTLSFKQSPKTKDTKKMGVWNFDGETLYFEYLNKSGNKLMEFRGKLRDPNTLFGESITKKDGKSEQLFNRFR